MYSRHGDVIQGGLARDAADYAPVQSPAIGVIWRVKLSDDPTNPLTYGESVGRSYGAMAHVIIVNDGSENGWEVENALLPAPGPGGWQDFAEWLPRGCTQAVDGTSFRDAAIQDYSLLDGTWCLVSFVGGKVTIPVVTGYLPHPRNRLDPSTDGYNGDLEQRGRGPTMRWAGTKFSWGSDGSLSLNTNGANEQVVGSPGDVPVRTPQDGGGNVYVDMKSSAELAVDFNAPVDNPANPSPLQPNPPDPAVLAAEEALAAERRVEQAAAEAAARASEAVQGALLAGAAAAVAPAEAALTAAQAAVAAAQAQAQAQAVATTAALVARASAVPPDIAAVERLAQIAAAQAVAAAFAAERAAVTAAENALVSAEGALEEAQSLAEWAAEATAAGAAPLTTATRSVDRLLPDGTYVRARSRVEWDEFVLSFVGGITARLMARGGDDSVEVGGTPESPPAYHATLAEPLRAVWDENAASFDSLVDALNEVRVLVDLQPVAYSARRFPDAAESSVVKVK